MTVVCVVILYAYSLLGAVNAAEAPGEQCDKSGLAALHCLKNNELALALSVMALLVLSPVVVASLLCCNTGDNSDPTARKRTLSRKERRSLASSKDISINIADIDNPLGSEHCTTFHKPNGGKATTLVSSHSVSSVLEEQPSTITRNPLLESTLDIGTRPSSRHDASQSSMISLGPRVPPEGSSLVNLTEKPSSVLTLSSTPHLLTDMPPPPSVPPPSSHLRQHSTPVALPSPLPPLQKTRPLTIIGHPASDQPSGKPATSHPASPTLSPVSLAESEALVSLRPGQVRPYRVVHQPSSSFSSLPHLVPHSSDGTLCTQCGARLGPEPAEAEPEDPNTSEELCQQCLVNDPHYHELDQSDDDPPSPPPPINGSPEPDPLYERIGSIRNRHRLISSVTTASRGSTSDERSEVTTATLRSRPPAPSPTHIPSRKDGSVRGSENTTSSTSRLPTCPLPSEGAPLPPRPPTLGFLTGGSSGEHNYESLLSTFGIDSPEETVYARISSPEEEEAETPPYIPENSSRAHMLKIDSQGYAEVVSGEQEDEASTPDSGPDYSPLDHTQLSTRHAAASDYEVPVRMAPLSPLSSSLLHPSPTHTQPSPIPVPTPVPPSSATLNVTQPLVPLPSEHKSSSAASHLIRQEAMAENPLPLPARSLCVLPQADSHDSRRDSSDSTASYHLTFRFSTTSSGLGESMSESLRAIAEELGQGQGQEEGRESSGSNEDKDTAVINQKIYEVENRSRTKSYPNRGAVRSPVAGSHKQKAQTVHIQTFISFNKDSQTV